MDFWAALRDLYLEKKRLDRVIETLEALVRGEDVPVKSRRGRKHMPEEERRVVSERMKRYWASKSKSDV